MSYTNDFSSRFTGSTGATATVEPVDETALGTVIDTVVPAAPASPSARDRLARLKDRAPRVTRRGLGVAGAMLVSALIGGVAVAAVDGDNGTTLTPTTSTTTPDGTTVQFPDGTSFGPGFGGPMGGRMGGPMGGGRGGVGGQMPQGLTQGTAPQPGTAPQDGSSPQIDTGASTSADAGFSL